MPSYPGAQCGAPVAANQPAPAYPGFGAQQYGLQAAIPGFPPPPAMSFSMPNGSVVAPEQPQPVPAYAAPAPKLGMAEGPDPFSNLVSGFKAALPGTPAGAAAQGLPGFLPADPAGSYGGGFGAFPQAQIPTNGQIPALHASAAPSSFPASSGGTAPGAKSGNPFA